MTLLFSFIAAVVSLLCVEYCTAYFVHIDAHAEECFFDKVTSGTKMSLMFEVAEGGFLDIDVKVSASLLRCVDQPPTPTPPHPTSSSRLRYINNIGYMVLFLHYDCQ